MPIDLETFHGDLIQDIHSSADADGRYAEDAFFDIFCQSLIDAGDLDTADRAHYLGPRGLRVDGYGGDPATSDGVLSLIVADFNQATEVTTLTATEMDADFKRLSNFLERSLRSDFREALEESNEGFGLADLISSRWQEVSKVRLFLITNRVLSTRVDGRESGELQGIPVTYNVWDLSRLHRYSTSGSEREDIEVDFEAGFGGPLALLPAHTASTAGYEGYLAVIRGDQLADIYDRWGVRLLEQNVRVFLQARGNVNRGIRNTLDNEPGMFFAYNNGISATAESVVTEQTDQGLLLKRLRNLQIVNGGQTTASIHLARRNKKDLSHVFVQMKLSIVQPENAIEVVPNISRFANSQNSVNAADFFANHPFHVRIEEFSRRIVAPSPDGTFRGSKWFYERARGQYLDARGYLTPAERRKFDLEYPKAQSFTKPDLAKFLNVWRGEPHTVSKGAQRNFGDFAKTITTDWDRNSNNFNEMYFRELVAKAIVFKAMEKLVPQQPWYQGGYRANVVAYGIAKLAYDLAGSGTSLDFERIWQAQAVSPELQESLVAAATAAHDVIVDPPPTMRNVTEWAKQQACWNRVSELHVDWPKSLAGELVGRSQVAQQRKAAVKNQRELNGIDAQVAVANAGADLWQSVRDWGGERGLLSPDDQTALAIAVAIPNKIPDEIQSARILETLRRLQSEGCLIKLNG